MPAKGAASFAKVLAEAVDAISREGYADQAILDMWMIRLREAAERELPTSAETQRQIRATLEQIYERVAGRGRDVAMAPDVPLFTLAQVRPALRGELDRRILASADLNKLNRKAAVEKTLQRFAGWSTSIPPGGAGVISKRGVKADIGKSIKQAKYEARRVAIDQGHKLSANVSNIIAVDGGALAVVWRSHWRRPGYDYRKDHKERDEKVYAIRGNWALDKGLMKPGKPGYLDQVTMFGEEPFCSCNGEYLFSLRDLPEEMLTEKGRAALAKKAA